MSDEDEDLMRGVAVVETEWRQSDSCAVWYRRYIVFNAGAGLHLFNSKALDVEQWLGIRSGYWKHLADVVAYKQLRAFLDDRFDAIGPNVILARPFDYLPCNSERLE